MKINNSSTLLLDKELKLNFDEKSRILTHYISTEIVNQYGYRLLNKGMNDADYRLNPVVLWQHELEGGICSSMPKPKDLIIGKNLSLKIDAKGVLAETQFADTELGNDIMELNRDGLLNAWSVRWNYVTDEETDLTEIDKIPTVLNWKIFEYSSVVIPGNPTAVNELKQMLSLTKTDRLKRFLVFDLAKAEIYTVLKELQTKYDTVLAAINQLESSKALSDSMVVQSILFDVKKWTVEEAKAWLKENDYKYDKVDTTEEYHRFRQREPSDFDEDSFRTVDWGEGKKAIMGKLKKSDSDGENKLKTDLRNEFKSLTGNLDKILTDRILLLASSVNSIQGNLHEYILSEMPAMIEKAIRKFTGKLD